MAKRQLELRSWPLIGVAYVLGPLLGLNVLWAADAIPAMVGPGFNPEGALTSWFLIIWFGGVACLVVELVVVTPILRAFTRHRWPWLNGWTAAALGFLLGAFPGLALSTSLLWPDWPSVRVGRGPDGQTGIAGPTLREMDGDWGVAGWAHPVHDASMLGMVGLIAAIAFRAIAVRTVGSRPDAGAHLIRQAPA